MLHVPQQIKQPVEKRLDNHFRTFLLEKLLDLIIAVTLRRHGPNLADDADDGLDLQPVDFDCRETCSAAAQSAPHRGTVLERGNNSRIGFL